MRQLKFRAWDNVKNKMYYVGEETDICFSFNSSVIEAVDISEEPEFKDLYHLIYMQYTGLKDKNGKEIYEGDIIESEEIDFNDSGNYAGMKRVCGSVVFMSGKFIFHKTTGALADVSTASIYNKVIGNIYENPELLEV